MFTIDQRSVKTLFVWVETVCLPGPSPSHLPSLGPILPRSQSRPFLPSLFPQTKPENRPTLDQVESLPFLARAKPHLPPSLPLSALHSPPPADWLVIPRTTMPKSSATSPISPPGPLATTRRPLGLRDSNALPLSRPPIKIHADPPGKKRTHPLTQSNTSKQTVKLGF